MLSRLKIICVICFSVFFAVGLDSQSCYIDEVIGNNQNVYYQNLIKNISKQKVITKSSVPIQIPLTFHFVKTNSLSQAEFPSEIENDIDLKNNISELNREVVPIDLKFYQCGILNFINGPDTLGFSDREVLAEIHAKNRVPNTINVYIVERINFGESIAKYAGFATLPTESNSAERLIVMTRQGFKLNGLFIHEMGHQLGLYHTHETFFGDELVNRTNCREAGDLLCDTPADPNLGFASIGFGCSYQDNFRDSSGDKYEPDINNFMSYSPSRCIISFSDQQLEVMRFNVENIFSFKPECDELNTSDSWIAPNPVSSNVLRVYANNDFLPIDVNLFIWSSDGRLIKSFSSFKNSQEAIFLVNISDLPKGLYFLSAQFIGRAQNEMESYTFIRI